MRWLVGVGVALLLLGVAVDVARDFLALGRPAERPDASRIAPAAGTLAMAERLARIAADADPMVNGFLNERRAALYRELADASASAFRQARTRGEELSPMRHLGDRVAAGWEALLAGDPEQALADFAAVRAELEAAPGAVPPAFGEQLADLVALAHLRLGEQENCIAHHGPDSCLLPIRASGVHVEPRGSRGAVAEYTAILARRPDDLSARWLLNVAAMTLGEWPDGVPARWRVPPEAFASQAPFARFVNVAPERGADVFGLGGGVVMDDLDADGDLDLLCSSWGLSDPLALLLNDGAARFEDRTEEAGLAGLVGGRNLTHGDVDGDGVPDVYVMRGAFVPDGGEHPDSLLLNDGRASFEDVTERAGMLEAAPTIGAVFADLDGDGRLDLFVARQTLGRIDAPDAPVRRGEYPCRLFVNRGGVTFDEQSDARGAALVVNASGVIAGDVDADGDQDLFVPTLGRDNALLVNAGGRFTDGARAAGLAQPRDATFSTFLDADQDGDLDLFVAGYEPTAYAADVCAAALGLPVDGNPPRLFLNRGNGTFVELGEEAGLPRVLHAIGGNAGDFDGDGLPDLYLGTGEPDLRAVFPNRMLRRADEGVRFEDVTTAAGTGHVQKGHGVAVGDVDGDGDQDVYCVLGGVYSGDRFGNALFENPGAGRWLTVRPRAEGSNRLAHGARVRARVERPDGSRRDVFGWVTAGGTFGSSSLQIELGLGDATDVLELELRWPGRAAATVTYADVPLDRIVVVHEDGTLELP